MTPRFYAAPLQGLTNAAWRRLHRSSPYGADEYFSPFLRLESGAPRPRDLRDLAADPEATPQIIFRDFSEFEALVVALAACGYSSIDLNLGCPFPPQVKKGRGAGMLLNPPVMAEVRDFALNRPDLKFSIKMRPGVESPNDWLAIAPIINSMPLRHIAIHPRLIRNPYDGPLLMPEFARMVAELNHPIIYNGSLSTPADIDSILKTTPSVSGIMIGRALLSRPTLIAEWRSGRELSEAERGRALMRLNGELLNEISQKLCGEAQILQNIKPYWQLAPNEIFGRKMLKTIQKATTLSKLIAALKQ